MATGVLSAALLLGSPSADAASVSLDAYVTNIEENPIEVHRGKKRALTESEKRLLEQQDELRRLRSEAAAPKSSAAPAQPAPPPPPTVSPPTLPSSPPPAPVVSSAPVAVPSEPAESGGGIGNLVGIVAAGVLGGLLYQSKKSNETAQGDFQKQLAGRDKEAADLKSKFLEMERIAEQREAAAQRLQQDMESQRVASASALQARELAVKEAKREQEIVRSELAQRNKLNEALQVEVSWSDGLRAKEQKRRETVERDNEALEAAKRAVEQQRERLKSELQAETQRSEQLSGRLAEQTSRSEGLERDLAASNKRSAEFEASLAAEMDKAAALTTELMIENDKNAKLEGDLAEESARAKELRTELEASKKRGLELRAKLDAEADKAEQLQETLQGERQRSEGLAQELAKQTELSSSLREQLNTTTANYDAEVEKRVAAEKELADTIAELEETKQAAEDAAAAAAQRMKELGEELDAATEVLNRQESENADLKKQADEIRSRYLLAQDNVEEEQGVVMRMQKEIARLKRYEIDNEYLTTENKKMKGELRGLGENLSTTRAALETAKAEAEAQRKKSEATLNELQTALDSIQSQVLQVVKDGDGGTKVLRSPEAPEVYSDATAAQPAVVVPEKQSLRSVMLPAEPDDSNGAVAASPTRQRKRSRKAALAGNGTGKKK